MEIYVMHIKYEKPINFPSDNVQKSEANLKTIWMKFVAETTKKNMIFTRNNILRFSGGQLFLPFIAQNATCLQEKPGFMQVFIYDQTDLSAAGSQFVNIIETQPQTTIKNFQR